MSALVPLMTSTGPLLDRASASVRAILNVVNTSESQFFDEGHFNASTVRKELQDTNVESKTVALKRLLAAHACGTDVSGLLPEVVKAIAVSDIELKRLVYLFLVQHAESCRDVTLLSINSFQKDLVDRDQVVRATALKALASIQLLEVVQLSVSALKRAAADSSPFVRRTAAQCVPAVFALDPDQFPTLQKIVLTLLGDVDVSVVGAALLAFRELCLRHADSILSYSRQQQPQQQQHVQESRESEGNNDTADEEEQPMTEQLASRLSQRSAEENDSINCKHSIKQDISISSDSCGISDTELSNQHNIMDAQTGQILSSTATSAQASPKAQKQKSRTSITPGKDFDAQTSAIALLHKHYRRLQACLLELEPYAQVIAIDLFLRYARLFFTEPAKLLKKKRQHVREQGHLKQHRHSSEKAEHVGNRLWLQQQQGKQHGGAGLHQYVGEGLCPSMTQQHSASSSSSNVMTNCQAEPALSFESFINESSENFLPEDFRAFLLNLGRLLHSESPAVVTAAATAFFYTLPPSAWQSVVLPLLRCVYTSSPDLQEPLLHTIATFSAAAPNLFLPHIHNFFLSYNDLPFVKQAKLLVLQNLAMPRKKSSLLSPAAVRVAFSILRELQTYIRWPGDSLLLSAYFRFLTSLALRFPCTQHACMQFLVQLLGAPPASALASEAILALQRLLQQQREQQPQHQREQLDKRKQPKHLRDSSMGGQQVGKLVLQLAMQLNRVEQSAAARASVVWIVGQYQREIGWVAADLFRQLACTFKSEAEEVKLQILLLGLKVWAFHWLNKQQREQHSFKKVKEQQPQLQQSMLGTYDAYSRNSATAANAYPSGNPSSAEHIAENGTAAAETSAEKPNADMHAHIEKVCASQQDHSNKCAAAADDSLASRVAQVDLKNQQQQQHTQERLNKVCKEMTHLQHLPPSAVEKNGLVLPSPTSEESAVAFPRLDGILRYVCEVAAYDVSYDVRDMARLYFALSRFALLNDSISRCNSMNSQSNKVSAPAVTAPEASGSEPIIEGLAGCGTNRTKMKDAAVVEDMKLFARKYLHTLAVGDSEFAQIVTPGSAEKKSNSFEVVASGALQQQQHLQEDTCEPSYMLGTLSNFVGERLPGYVSLPPFTSVCSSDDLRAGDMPVTSAAGVIRYSQGSRIYAAAAANSACIEKSSNSTTLDQPLARFYNAQELKAISSDDFVVKRNAATLMGKEATAAKLGISPLDLDSFYAADDFSSSVAALTGDRSAFAGGAAPPVVALGGASDVRHTLSEQSAAAVGIAAAVGNGQQRGDVIMLKQQAGWDMWQSFGEQQKYQQQKYQQQQQSDAMINYQLSTENDSQIFRGGDAGTFHAAKRGVAVAGEDDESEEEERNALARADIVKKQGHQKNYSESWGAVGARGAAAEVRYSEEDDDREEGIWQYMPSSMKNSRQYG